MSQVRWRTDLACERCIVKENDEGVNYSERKERNVSINELVIKTEAASEEYGIPIGRYSTLSFPALQDIQYDTVEDISCVLSQILEDYLHRVTNRSTLSGATVAVVGLGNRHMTADAVGPTAIKDINATYHIAETDPELFEKYFYAKTVTLTPGVTSQTGVESADIVKSVCEKIKPDAVIAIDALAARSRERLATTIQICDTGITPGSGIGNTRRALNSKTLLCPVIAIGVPTVVEARTLIYDEWEKSGAAIPDEALERLSAQSFFVSPKECDLVTENAARIISQAISSVLNGSIFAE